MSLQTLLKVLLIGMCYLSSSGKKHNRKKARHEIDNPDDFVDELLRNYKRTRRPAENLSIKIILHVNTLSSVSEITMDYNIDMYFDQEWVDHRLAHNWTTQRITMDKERAQTLWHPDTYFLNAKHGHGHDLGANECAFLSPDGTVRYSQRVSLVVSCSMNLHYFPMDEQDCSLIIGSYGHPAKEISYGFIANDSTTFEESLILPDFVLDTGHVIQNHHFWEFPIGTFSCLEFVFHLKRDFGYYLIQTYIPSVLVVVLSWLNFWLDVHATPARISVGCLTVLTMATQASGINNQLPRVSYIKAIDVWMSTCMVFVFGGLLEFAVANVITRREAKQREKALQPKIYPDYRNRCNEYIRMKELKRPRVTATQSKNNVGSPTSVKDGAESPWEPMNSHPPKQPPKPKNKTGCAEKVEMASRFLFPMSFCVFNLVYWLHYWCRWFENGRCTY
ncbi:glycine receptor subunit alpha-2-like isoform X2 [Lineus longissimus]|uniref:glycine receptor subunit alpha-2-like isoform X2 n=1 Tax=Lineus longissimus TaxID=88925 RepID=UPI002B4C8560